jgi:serine phosphatase RsbU (regulator of sigma subunit)
MEYLEITDVTGRRRRIELKRSRLLIGREPTCDVYLPHPNVSRRHAQIQRGPKNEWILQDLNSLNHVYVEERPVQQIVLETGLEVRIADYRLALLEASTIIEPGKAAEAATGEPWTSLGPGWLDQLHIFQRTVLHLDQPRQVLERLAEEFCRIVQPRLVAVGTTGAERYHWEVVVGPEGEPNGSALDEALKYTVRTDSEVHAWSPAPAAESDTPGPAPSLSLLFPMKGRSGVIGHVYVLSPRHGSLPPEVQRYLTLLATHAGLVWDNLHLAALRSAQKQFDAELRQARQIQTELFPPTFEVHEELNAFAVNLPSVHVSGDYYDLVRTGPSTVAFVIADAMGHGMPAALLMAAVRSGLRMGLAMGWPWEQVFKGLDEVIAQAREGAFVTGIVGQVDLAAHQLRIVSAGHVLPSILVGGRPVPLPAGCQTRPWGLDFESPWQVGRLDLGAADWSVLCYTDGIIEGGSSRGESALNAQRLAAYHQNNPRHSAEDLCQGVLSEAAARQPAGSLADDQTVLVVRSAAGIERKPTTTHRAPTIAQ